MNVKDMSIEELESVKIISVEHGRLFAEEIRQEQIAIHHQMLSIDDDKEWKMLCGRHYELRKVRIGILMKAGRIYQEQKRNTMR